MARISRNAIKNEKFNFNMCYCIQNNMVIILLEMINKCRNDQCPASQECEGNSPNYREGTKLAQRNKKSGLMMNKVIEPPKDPTLSNFSNIIMV